MERKQVKPFATWLREQPGGLHDEISIALADLGKAVSEYRSKGSIVLTIKMGPVAKNDRSVVETTTDIKRNLPEADRAVGIFFTDDDGNLHRDDPRQIRFDNLEAVPTDDGIIHTVDSETGEIIEMTGVK